MNLKITKRKSLHMMKFIKKGDLWKVTLHVLLRIVQKFILNLRITLIVIESLKKILSTSNKKNLLPRADYWECDELRMILLGEIPERGIYWTKPGAVDHAQWVPFIMYYAKMFAFSSEAGYDKGKISKTEVLCKFYAL